MILIGIGLFKIFPHLHGVQCIKVNPLKTDPEYTRAGVYRTYVL